MDSEETDEELNSLVCYVMFNHGFVQKWRKKLPKQAQNEIIQKKLSFQIAPLFIVRFVCLVVRLN